MREQEHVVEHRPDARAGLVQRGDGGDAARGRRLAKQPHGARGLVRVEAGGRLVGDEKRRVRQQRAAEREAPLLPAADAAAQRIADPRVLHGRDTERGEEEVDLFGLRPLQTRSELQRLSHRQQAEEGVRLVEHADLAARRDRCVTRARDAQPRPRTAGERPEQRALARARRAQNAEQPAGRSLNVHRLQERLPVSLDRERGPAHRGGGGERDADAGREHGFGWF
mmetsp:Transcript_24191/g.77639  ORF Transcript_24191/g.77639 Transcript_24191/m.77639 type:complete len:225 (-) Transcript_24191:90-764(-)